MIVDEEKTKQFYASEKSLPCSCNYCKNYCQQIQNVYPNISAYLASLQVEATRPFELVFGEPDENHVLAYYGCQYVVFGTCEDNFRHEIDGVVFEKSLCHPSTNLGDDAHFVLEFGPITLNMRLPL